jgi:hypothetical protein
MTSWLVSGRPRQFIEMWENRRCSILFHLLVPGGRWQTVIRRPVWAARVASSVFHSLVREPLGCADQPDPPRGTTRIDRWARGAAAQRRPAVTLTGSAGTPDAFSGGLVGRAYGHPTWWNSSSRS